METTLYIQNLKCGGCETTIVNKLSKLKGINSIFVNNNNSSVKIEHDTTLNTEEVKKQLSSLGYPVLDEKNSLGKKAKSYVSCAIGKLHQKG